MTNKPLPMDPTKQGQDSNLTEEVLRDAGKSEHEIESTGKVDRVDEGTDALFGEKQRTANGPVHRLVWGEACLADFAPHPLSRSEKLHAVVADSVALVRRHAEDGTLYGADNKVSRGVQKELGKTGYWGMLIDPQYGGQGASIRSAMHLITQMSARGCPSTAGLASINWCIGAVDPLRTFGSEEQKARFLPGLAAGERPSGFGLTERGAGSDMTSIKTTAVLDGEDYVVNGEKLFISNAVYGHTIGLVCLIDDVPAVLIVELPQQETANFKVVPYGLHALIHIPNNGLLFQDFRVSASNRITAPGDNGLVIAFHGLGLGRVALCANAAGVLRRLLRSITPDGWGKYRQTYGQSIEKRELVKRRMARLAALIVGSDALVAWSSSRLDDGYRGELECIAAKVFGSEAQKEAAIELAMKTHGGRTFLHGHFIGDNLFDFLAPCIYEGEGEMLSMKFFASLLKEHGTNFMLPLGEAVKNLKKGLIAEGLSRHGVAYAKWCLGRKLRRVSSEKVPGMDARLAGHVKFAQKMFAALPLELSLTMVKHQVKLADRQCRMSYLSQRAQDMVVMLVTAIYAHHIGDEVTIAAADILCQDLRRKLTGEQPSDAYFKACSKLADMVVDGQMQQLVDVPGTPILQQYK